MALDPNTKPTTQGTFAGEIRNGWTWVTYAGTNDWFDFSGINIGNTNVVDNLTNAGVTTLGLGSPVGLPDFGIDLDNITEAIKRENPDFNINVNAGFGNGPEFRNLNTNQLNTLLTNVQPGIVAEPFDYSISLIFKTTPNIGWGSYKVSGFPTFGNGITSALLDTSAKQLSTPTTFEAKATGFGSSQNKFKLTRIQKTNSIGLQEYRIEVREDGGLVATLDPKNAVFEMNFKMREEEKEVIIPKGIAVSIQPTTPNGITFNASLGGVTETVSGDTSIVNDEISRGTLNIKSVGTDSTCNYQYELYDAAGALVSTGTAKDFTSPTLSSQRYILKAIVSKVSVPVLPSDDPSYTYKKEVYYETSTQTKGTVAAGPRAVTTTADLLTQAVVNVGVGATDDTTVNIKYSSTNADYVNFTIGTSTRRLNTSGTVYLDESDLFNGAGNYTVYFQAVSNRDGSGNIVPIKFTVVRKDLLPGPDIRTIEYPQQITGKDYQGYNVDFEISWTSINTNYVDIYVGDTVSSKKILSKGSPDGVQSFNIASILRKAGDTLDENVDVAVFDLKLIPYNEEGDSKTSGKTETIQISFDKGNIQLRRDSVLRDIKDAICDLFDTSILGGDSSKYLTHLMHFGDADNKLIASWDTDYETFSEYEFVEETGERVKIAGTEEKTLIFKLYEPLPRDIQPNQQLWVSKIQSIPYVEQITLVNESIEDCVELVPNFGKDVCGENIGYQLYDELVASGSSSSTKLLSEYVSGSGFDLKNLDIHFVSSSKEISGSLLVDGDSTWAWNNFVKYSSAEERVDNFIYKIELMEFYNKKNTELTSGSFHTGSITLTNEISRNSQSVQDIKDNFDAFESFLYTSSSIGGLTYPGAGGSSISASTSTDAVDWYDTIISSARNYDVDNKDFLVNNLPLHVQNSADSDQFKVFFNMMGHHFDVLYSYTKSIAQKKNLEHKYDVGIKDSLLAEMLKSLSWDAKIPAKAQSLWEYAFAETSDGTSVSSMSGKQIQNQVWRRLLNNLPYLLKHKGSHRAVKAALSCYGVPSSMLTIMEFGGPRNGDGGISKVTFEDRTAAININGTQSILVPWKQYNETSDYPNSVELRVNSNIKQDQTFVTSSLWNVGVIHHYRNQAKLKLTVAHTSGSYFVTSSEFPFFNDEYTQIVVEKNGNTFSVKGKEAFQGRIRSEVSASIEVENHIWQTDTTLKIGDGSTFTGSVDEFRYWTVPLSESRVDNHTLMPDAIDGNHVSSSTEDLILRLDFEYPKNRNTDTAIKNVSINEGYNVPFVTASNFDSITEYPYHYTPYERTVTANVPSSGFNVSQKFRFEEQSGLTEDIDKGLSLSYRERSTKKSFDTAPVDSNRLGMFFSPIKEINMDILKSLGQFELDDYIGDPSDEYQYEYGKLKTLRNYYFKRYSINLYEYIQLVRYIDQSLFQTLESLVPARAIVSSGLLIEPHILERNKVKRTKPQAVDYGSKFQDGVLTLRESLQLSMVPITQWPANLRLQEQVRLAGLQSQYDGFIQNVEPTFNGTFTDLVGRLNNLSPTLVSTYDLLDGKITDSKIVDKLIKQFEALGGQEQVGIDIQNLTNGLAGITADNGYAIITKLDGNGRLIKVKKQVFIVEESYTIKIPRLINPLDPSLGYYDELVTKTRKIVVFAEIGDVGPQVGGNILSVTRANSNGGNILGSSNMGNKYSDGRFKSPSLQTVNTTLDGKSPVETFCTNPNILKVADTARGAGEPILQVEG